MGKWISKKIFRRPMPMRLQARASLWPYHVDLGVSSLVPISTLPLWSLILSVFDCQCSESFSMVLPRCLGLSSEIKFLRDSPFDFDPRDGIWCWMDCEWPQGKVRHFRCLRLVSDHCLGCVVLVSLSASSWGRTVVILTFTTVARWRHKCTPQPLRRCKKTSGHAFRETA